MRVCTPHCGLDPEARLGGEVYEREILRALADRGMVFDILLARHKRLPEGVANWIVHRLPIGRGLRWPVAALLLPPIIKRVHDATRFDVLRVHSLRYIGPAALRARRRYRLDVPIVAHHHHLDAGSGSGDVRCDVDGIGHQVGFGEHDDRSRPAVPCQRNETFDPAQVRLGGQGHHDQRVVRVGR